MKKEFKLKRFVLGITIWSKMHMRKQTDINREIATMIAFQHSITTGSNYRFAKYVSVNIRQSGERERESERKHDTESERKHATYAV